MKIVVPAEQVKADTAKMRAVRAAMERAGAPAVSADGFEDDPLDDFLAAPASHKAASPAAVEQPVSTTPVGTSSMPSDFPFADMGDAASIRPAVGSGGIASTVDATSLVSSRTSASSSRSRIADLCSYSPNESVQVDNKRRALPTAHMARIAWLDIARAIAVIAFVLYSIASVFSSVPQERIPPTLDPSILTNIVLAPTEPLNNFISFLGAFACPLLFISIGYAMRRPRISLSYISKTITKYLIPYLVFGIICAAIYGIFGTGSIFEYFASLLYGNGGIRADNLILASPFGAVSMSVLWLFPTLMLAQLMTFFLSKVPLLTRLAFAGFLFFIGEGSAGYIFLPFDIQQAMCATWFMTCGGVLRETHAFMAWRWEKALFGCCATLGAGYIICVSLGFMGAPSYPISLFPSGIIDMLGGVCAAIVFMLMARLIALSPPAFSSAVSYIGRAYLPILCSLAVIVAILSVFPLSLIH